MKPNTTQLTKVIIFGVGLIGGSFALALKKQSVVKQIIGVDRDSSVLAQALSLGIIDTVGDDLPSTLKDADLILIAAPVAQTESILRSIYPHLTPQTVVTDAGSTKSDVVAAARRALNDKLHQFVPAHPIAGRELSGPQAAVANLYQDKKIIITPLAENTPTAIDLVTSTWQRCGAVASVLTPAEHDHIFAAVSHLPHVLAYAMINHITEQPDADARFHYAASGFRDFTRIAGASPEMWRDICMANRDAVQKELALYQTQLNRIAAALGQADGEQLLAIFSDAQVGRQRWIQSAPATSGNDEA